MDHPTTESPRRWFEAALEQPASTRGAWLAQHCQSPAMRTRVLALLAADADARTNLLDLPVASVIEQWRADASLPAPEALVGTRIGAFRLTGLLGQGGMATVYLAEREGVDFQQRVAIKLLRHGLYSELERQLFVRERRMLATLSHPAIARLIDGGVTEAGIPYLVMEHVDGVPITCHATEHRLGLSARLQLFQVVCRAVDAAHRQLVVHRDIKPSNLLVTASGEVKLLDFGIATLIDDSGGAGAAQDAVSGLTPGYAAPEQYVGGSISTATDVYALGVLLHELLLGERPGSHCDRPSLRTQGIDRAQSTVPLSSAALGAALRGDLDSLLLKALASDPAQRYASAGALADDVQRHLRNEPIEARIPTPAYRAQKFVRRHRGGVSIAAILALAVFASLGAALWQTRVARIEAQRANAQAQVAQREAQRANAAREMLVELFENERPGNARSQLPDTATLLRRGAARAHDELAATPALQVDMLVTIGRIYDQLSRYDDARPLLERALATARRLPPEEVDALIDALAQLGQLELSQKHYGKALSLLDEALILQQPRYPEGLTTASLLHQRALLYGETDRHGEAIADYLDSLAIRHQRLRPDHPLLIRSYGALGTAYGRARQFDQALPWLRRALALSRRIHGDVHEETARRLSNLSISLLALDHHEEATHAIAEAVVISRQVYPGPNTSLAAQVHNLGSAYLASGRLDAAQAALRESIAIEQKIGLGKTPGVGFALGKLSRVQECRGDLAGALSLALEAQDILSATLGPTHTLRLDAELRSMRLRLLQPGTTDDLRHAAAALHVRVSALDAPPPGLVATALQVQALAKSNAGDIAGATHDATRALRLLDATIPLPQDMLPLFTTLAQLRLRQGDKAGAGRALNEGLVFADKRRMPPSHPARLPLSRMLAQIESPRTGARPR